MLMIVIILSPTVEEALVEDDWPVENPVGDIVHILWLIDTCHMSTRKKKKIELILIIILAAPLDSMIKFKIYFSGFQEN